MVQQQQQQLFPFFYQYVAVKVLLSCPPRAVLYQFLSTSFGPLVEIFVKKVTGGFPLNYKECLKGVHWAIRRSSGKNPKFLSFYSCAICL